jgi:hypothetical protein
MPPIPPPDARLEAKNLGELLKLAYGAWSRFAYGNRRVFGAFWLLWLVLHGMRVYNTSAAFTSNGGLNMGLIITYVALNIVGVLIGAAIAYGGLRLSIVSWRGTNSVPMIAGTVITIIGLAILVASPLFYEFFASYNRAVYDCMVDLGMNTRDACDKIVSEQYQRRPMWEPFYRYIPQR